MYVFAARWRPRRTEGRTWLNIRYNIIINDCYYAKYNEASQQQFNFNK